ncbi:MAG: hypothetical protein K0R67_2974 [Paenibacillus sp.]|nr:hypothetical protein [Paenibacillus sp.]
MLVLAAIAAAGIIVLGIETLVVRKSCYSLNHPTSDERFTVVQLTDLHGRTRFINGSLSSIVNSIRPDYVMITGDLVTRMNQIGAVLDQLRQIECRSIYFVPGNYEREGVQGFSKRTYTAEEYTHLMKLLMEQGITVLENSEASMNGEGGRRLFVYGFDNSIYGNEQLSSKAEDWLGYDYVILLAHSPSIIEFVERSQLPYDLLLVGHTHGGQVRIWNRTIGAYKHFHVGMKHLGGRKHFFINRGLGTVKLPVRFACPPEIAVFRIGG